MENTKFLKLKKPDELDQYAVDDFNSNMDTIDLAVEKLEEMSVEMASDGSPRYFLSTQNTMPAFYDVGKFIGKSEVVVPVAPDTGVQAEMAKFVGITYPQSKELLAGKATGAFYLWSDRMEPFVATAKLYKMLASGDIELIAESSVDVSNVNQNVPTSISIDIVAPVMLAVNERILYKVYATIGVVGQVVNFAFGGSSRPSRVVLPMNDEHNDLVGIQGGATAERYHLTRDQHDKNLLNDGDASNVRNRFTMASVRENLADGELLKISLGKLMKWFADLKPVAWSGNASDLIEDASNRLVTDSEKSTWNAKASTAVVTTSANGLMSSTDKTKLDGVASNANNYTHPSTHPATMIVQDASNRFVTDSEKSTWNGKASTAVATTSANGLMSSTDKTKLDGVASNANNYTHPSTHPATMVVQDASNRFVTDSEKSTWNGKLSTNGNASNVTNTFTQAASRANLTSGESLSLSLGKLMKWFADLKPVAWSGSTLDLAEPNALSNIGTSANVKQNIVNIEVDEKIGSMIQSKSATTGSAGWYRIATSALGVQRNYATFDVDWYLSNHHGQTTLIAGNMYGAGTELTQLGYSEFGSNNVTKARIVYHTTYTNNYAYLEVYCATESLPLNVRMHDSTGWILTTPNTAGSVPSGYTYKEIGLGSGIVSAGNTMTNSNFVAKNDGIDVLRMGGTGNGDAFIDTQGSLYLSAGGDYGLDLIAYGGTGKVMVSGNEVWHAGNFQHLVLNDKMIGYVDSSHATTLLQDILLDLFSKSQILVGTNKPFELTFSTAATANFVRELNEFFIAKHGKGMNYTDGTFRMKVSTDNGSINVSNGGTIFCTYENNTDYFTFMFDYDGWSNTIVRNRQGIVHAPLSMEMETYLRTGQDHPINVYNTDYIDSITLTFCDYDSANTNNTRWDMSQTTIKRHAINMYDSLNKDSIFDCQYHHVMSSASGNAASTSNIQFMAWQFDEVSSTQFKILGKTYGGTGGAGDIVCCGICVEYSDTPFTTVASPLLGTDTLENKEKSIHH